MPPLVGRDPELATIDRFLRSVREGYQAVVFRGGAGYGKSVLLEETVARARRSGFRALTARPAETEAELPFGVLAELLEPVGTSELDLPAPQARALDVALRRADPDEARPSIRSGSASRWSRRSASSRTEQPLLVALDDLQWCDPPVAAHARVRAPARRVRADRARGRASFGRRSRSSRCPAATGHVTAVEVGPLDGPAFETVVRRGSSTSQTGASAALRGVRRQSAVRQGSRGAARRARASRRPAAPIPVPPSASDAIGQRVAKLGLGTRDVLLGPRPSRALPSTSCSRRTTSRASRTRSSRRRQPESWPSTASESVSRHPLVAAAVYECRHARPSPCRTRGARARARPPGGTGAASRACRHPSQRAPSRPSSSPPPPPRGRAARSTPPAGCWSRRSRSRPPATGPREDVEVSRPRAAITQPVTPTAPAACSIALVELSRPGEELAEVLLELALAGGTLLPERSSDTRTPRSKTHSRAQRSQFESTTA